MIRAYVAVVSLSLLLAAAWPMGSAVWAQDDKEDQVSSVLIQMRDAIAEGNVDAVADLLADSGFVAVTDSDEGPQCLNKAEFTEMLKALLAGGGVELALEDIKVKTHWLVATATAKLRLPDTAADDAMLFDAMLLREAGKWHIVALVVTQELEPADEEASRALLERISRIPEALKRGDADLLDAAIHDDHFVLCLVDPAYELRWANSKVAFRQMIDALIPMVTINDSRLDVSRTALSANAAVVDGTWFLDIPDLGQTNSVMRLYTVKVDGEWMIVAMAGGPQG